MVVLPLTGLRGMQGEFDVGNVPVLGSAFSATERPDQTSTGKEHFEVLDGLRGTAALLVVLFHIQGMAVLWRGPILLPHAPIAVDFFFALSGFVIGYAYDDRWRKMTPAGFFKLRLIRLHPLVILGVLLGFLSYVFDPFAGGAQTVSMVRLVIALLMGFLLIPTAPLPNRFNYTHSLDEPSWSLFWEYAGSVAYGLLLRRLSPRLLALIAGVSAIGLVLLAARFSAGGPLSPWNDFWIGRPVRMCFAFTMGLWLYRCRNRLPRLRVGWLALSIVLTIAVVVPPIPDFGGFLGLNGLYEAACIVLIFPLVVHAGSHSEAGRGMVSICKASGELSYPIYITHFPFLCVWFNFVASKHPSSWVVSVIGIGLVPFLLVAAWFAFRFWDVPIRRRIGRLRHRPNGALTTN